jgi:CubicO group peptidase (beta-lactamase class C family)
MSYDPCMAGRNQVMRWVTERLPALIDEYDVPAASVAVLADGEIADTAAGVLSKTTGVEATPDSIFQVGSITKLWTSSLLMQLVDEGRVDLDAPVRAYLSELHLQDESAAEQVTVRHLMTHTSGFEGDIFTDTGPGDDCVEKLVGVLRDVPQLFPPGQMWSYNNAGFVVLGRLIEVLRGKPYDTCLRQYLLAPLGLTHAATSPYEAILFRAAVGHIERQPDEGYQPAPVWALPRSNVPAGSMLAMSARDLLAFARMHLRDGTAADGTRVLAPGTTAQMHQEQVRLPRLGRYGDSWGLGFERFETRQGLVVGHDGGTVGQSAFLRIVPDAGVAVAVLTNGGIAASLNQEVVGHVLNELAGVHLRPFPKPPADPPRVDAARYVGNYASDVVDVAITQDDDGRVWLEETPKGLFEDLEAPKRRELVYYRDDTLISVEPERGLHGLHVFLGDDGTEHSQYMHVGRAIRRAGS